MKTHIYRSIFVLVLLFCGFLYIDGQTNTLLKDSFAVYPSYPTYSDSVFLSYRYISNDGCPDFYLTKDSVSGNKIYISLKKINDSGRICTQVISTFVAEINLGIFHEAKQLYVNEKYLLIN